MRKKRFIRVQLQRLIKLHLSEARTITGHQKATAYNKDKKTGRQYYSDDAVSIEIKVTEENFKNALFGNTIAGLGEEKATSTGFKITYS